VTDIAVAHWETIVPVGLLVLAIIGLLINNASTYLSIREHTTYQNFVQREMDTIGRRLDRLEDTRPTTGELEAKIGTKKPSCDK
jgi:hypothetical protein